MVTYAKVPYGDLNRWCRDRGYTKVPIRLYNPNSRPLLIVDNRINIMRHNETMVNFDTVTKYIKKAQGGDIYFGLRYNAIGYIGDKSLVVWRKK
jgi:hypothetical protein